MRDGFIYILRNPGLRSLKVGMTTRALYLRRDELHREYGTVYPFEIASRHAVANPAAVEALAHRLLARYRVRRSELFACDLETCERAVIKAAKHVLHCPWRLRLWYALTLPKSQAGRSYGRRGYRRDDPTALLLFLVVLGVVVALAALKPDLPAWLPSGILRAAYLVERHY